MAIFIPLVTKFDDKGLNGARRALASFQNFAVDVGRVAATALAGVAVAGVREAAQFENTFTRIRTLTSLSAEDAEYLQQVAREIGPAYGVSAKEAGDGLYFITSAGYSAAESAKILESALKAEFIGMGDVATVADLVTSAMYSFNDSELTAEDATNALLKAIRAAKAEPEELADAMGRVLPVASAMGISFEESAALAGILSQGGLDASEAMTALRGVMNSLLVPTAEAEKTLERYGFTAQEVRDSIEQDGLFNTLVTLDEAFGDNATAVGEVFGNVRALTGVFSLMGDSMAENAEIVGYVTNGVDELSGAVDIAREDSLNKFNVAMETARDSLLEIGGALLERLLPYLDDFKAFMDQNGPVIAEAFDNIFEFVDKVASKLAELGDAFLPTVMELMNNEQFQENVARLGENFFLIADQVIRFVESDLGQFLLDLTSHSVVGGLEILNNELERLANLMFVVNEAMDIFSGRAPSVDFETLMDRAGSAIGIRLSELSQYFLDLQSAQMGYSGRRAAGGPVSSGQSYLVGEMGPELFVPSAGGGRIVPNDRLGGGTNITINVTAGMGANGAQIGEQIVTAIKRYERTSGPVFASA